MQILWNHYYYGGLNVLALGCCWPVPLRRVLLEMIADLKPSEI